MSGSRYFAFVMSAVVISAPVSAGRGTEIPAAGLSAAAGVSDSVALGTVVVTGTRTPKTLKDVPIVTRVITAADIEKRNAADIKDLLQQELPGMEFTFAMNQQTTLDMQGFGGNGVLFLVDGERMAGETMDNIDYSRIDLQSIERIEIVKGAASSLYGSAAVGGVINIISKKQRRDWSANAGGRHGAHGEYRYGGLLGLRSGGLSSVTTVQRTAVDDINLLKPGQITAGDFNKIIGNTTWNVKERLVFKPSERLTLTARGGYFFRERNTLKSVKDRYRDYSGGLRADLSVGSAGNIELSYGYDQYDKSEYTVKTGSDDRNYSNRQHAVRALYNHSFAENTVLSVGGDWFSDYLMSYQFDGNGSRSQYNIDAFVQMDWALTERLSVIGGLRFDYFSGASVRHVSPKAGLMYRFPHLSLRASYSDGFRAPSLKEMFMDYDMAGIFMIYGNSGLRPETSDNLQLSAEYTRGRYNITVTGFCNFVDNRISTAWNTALGGQSYVNMSSMRISGVDASVSARYPCGISAHLSYVYTHESVKNGLPVGLSTRPHAATVRLDYDRRWSARQATGISLSGRLLSSADCMEYSLASFEETVERHYPGYAIWKLTASHRLFDACRLSVTVDNLLGYVPEYYYCKSPVTTGTTVSVGLSVDIDRIF